MHLLRLSILLLAPVAAAQDAAPDPSAIAIENLRALDEETQRAIVDGIAAAIDSSKDPGIAALVKLRERARSELPLLPSEAPKFFDPAVYAPVQGVRTLVDPASGDAARMYDTMRPWENVPPFYVARIRYDFGANCGRESPPTAPADRAADYLFGAIPDQDLLVAWMCFTLDTRSEFDAAAEHFAHVYCDLTGTAYPDVTIYDAFASQQGMDMPDVDVIAFARNLLKDDSFRSPIPANQRRQDLYDKIEQRFAEYFRYRTAIEYAAWIYVNPDCAIRSDHTALREYYWTLYARTKDSFDDAAKEWKAFEDRDEFKEKVNEWRRKNGSIVVAADRWRAARNATRWAVNAITVDHLKVRGLWPSEAAPEPSNPKTDDPAGDGSAKPESDGGGERKQDHDQEATMLRTGDPAPDFAIPDETGKVRTLAEFRGKTVVLWFYPKASTPG